MKFELSEGQIDFRDTLRRFLADQSPGTEVRRVMETELGHYPELWESMSRELGLPGVAIPEALGGQGFGFEELCVVQGELGRSLTPSPFFGSAVLAGWVAARVVPAGDADALLSHIASGQVVSLALAEKSFDLFDRAGVRTEAQGSGDQIKLTGTKRYVLDGLAATDFLVVARNGDRLGLYQVSAEAPGLQRRRLRTLDRTRRLAEVVFDATPARCLNDDAGAALEQALAEALVALCAESVGGLERILETAVAYAQERRQFSRPIGSFQAVKHKLADLWIQFEGARTATREATAATVEGRPDAALLASVAKAYVSEAYRHAAFENIQIHGGVGFTWEYDAHLYLRRAQFASSFLGDAPFHRERVARFLEQAAA